MKVTTLLNKMPKCQLVQIMLLSEEAEEIYRGKVEYAEYGLKLKVDELKVDGVCTFSSCDDTITIFVTMK